MLTLIIDIVSSLIINTYSLINKRTKVSLCPIVIIIKILVEIVIDALLAASFEGDPWNFQPFNVTPKGDEFNNSQALLAWSLGAPLSVAVALYH